MKPTAFATALILTVAATYQPVTGGGDPTPARSTIDSDVFVVDHARWKAGRYFLMIQKSASGQVRVEQIRSVINLEGEVLPTPDPEGPGENPDDGGGANPDDPLSAVPDHPRRELIREGLRQILNLSPSIVTAESAHVLVQSGFAAILGDDADKWKPWTDWFNKTAAITESIDDYRAWCQLAIESLEGS